MKLGLPTVQYCADRLCMSANYFGDVIKKTTGETASSHIRRFVIRLAKNGLAAGESVSQVSDRLGFEYPQHFSRMFRKNGGPHSVGVLPEPALLTNRRSAFFHRNSSAYAASSRSAASVCFSRCRLACSTASGR